MTSASTPSRPATSRVCAAAAAAVGAALLAGCSSGVPVPAAPDAANPVCASVVLALPQTLGDLERLSTTSQATTAWGDPRDPVVLRCGVVPPGPTTDSCVTADDGETSVDWLAVPQDEGSEGTDGAEDGAVDWTFTTYGRDPAVEVLVPASVIAGRSTSFLLDLGPAIALVEQTRTCL